MTMEEQLSMFAMPDDAGPPAREPYRSVRIDVRGVPRPQGSIQPIRRKDGGVFMRYAETLHSWRARVQQTVIDTDAKPFTGPVKLSLGFDLNRPAIHYSTSKTRPSGTLRPSALPWPITMPDLDKLVRAVGDACTAAGLWNDDSQVVWIEASKRYASPTGVLITVSTV